MRQFVFVSIYRFSEFGVDGGPAAKSLRPKFDIFWNHLSTHTGLKEPKQFEVRNFKFFCFNSITSYLYTTQVNFVLR